MSLMHALSRRVQTGLAIMAGCLLGACQTVGRPDYDEANLKYRPAPRSTLVDRQDLPFQLAQEQQGDVLMTFLAYQASGGKPSPVAVMMSSRSGNETHVSVQRLSIADTESKRSDLGIVTLEYLYTLVLRQDPEARFCFADLGHQCKASRKGYSHAEVLLQIARSRQQALGMSARATANVPWHVVTLASANVHHADPDDVSARIIGEHGPIEGATIFFNRAPHSTCEAKSREGGLASCHLIDQHGDEDAHSE